MPRNGHDEIFGDFVSVSDFNGSKNLFFNHDLGVAKPKFKFGGKVRDARTKLK